MRGEIHVCNVIVLWLDMKFWVESPIMQLICKAQLDTGFLNVVNQTPGIGIIFIPEFNETRGMRNDILNPYLPKPIPHSKPIPLFEPNGA